MNKNIQNNNRQVAYWLLLGVAMIFIQVLLGGITRLTESGLSITEWKPFKGALPPLNEIAWKSAFDSYKQTDQFKYLHQNFTISNFKFIFFWEWFHRLWARIMAVVFVVGFVYFILKNKFNTSMIVPMMVLFILGAMQGAIGWIMVKSGLVPEKYFVGHIQLATHFIAALFLLCYTLWFALSLLILPNKKIVNKGLLQLIIIILIILFFQLTYGAFMAGLKAASSAPTWPSINGYVFPPTLTEQNPWINNLFYNNITVQFIHRFFAYLLLILIIIWCIKAKAVINNNLFKKFRLNLFIIVFLQILLGIATVLNATNHSRLIILGVMHQAAAMLLLINTICILFLLLNKKHSI